MPTPIPGASQVLVQVAATSVNLSDWECLRGTPLYGRISGLRRPGRRTLGSDIAGRIVAIGSGVTRFQPGEAVYGESPMGGFAEFAVAGESAFAHKPEALSFVEASTIPQAGAIAMQGTAGVGPGQRVLINGAGGGSGSFAIQLAKQAGAYVIGVDNVSKLAFMESLGADETLDYRTQDFSKVEPSDLVLDLVAGRSVFAYRRALVRGGSYRCVGGSVPALLRVITVGNALGRLTGRRMGLLMVNAGPKTFEPLAERCVAGQIKIHIDRTFPLDAVPEALAHVGEGRALGKVVIEVA